jgi:hypothetical protein
MQNEPTLEQIDDYNNNESPEKRSTIIKVVVLCLVLGAFFAAMKIFFDNSEEYVGTAENPGINTARQF